jgi:murein DD-endopeptidase MepM/ murein hydrolase activator NlpD
LPVYAASKGTIIFADEAGPKWGKVIIVRHRLPDGTLVETLYSHLQSFERTGGEVNRREKIGSIGDGGGAYVCHLHFELRLSSSPSWGQVGPGYSGDSTGWTDPSDFIEANRFFKEIKVESSSNR